MVMDYLKITAKMASPVVINHDLMLDTLLITKKAVELKLDAQTLDPLKPLEVQDIVQYFGDIPLCSKAFFEGIDSKNVYYKRFDEDNEYFADTKKIKIGSGKYKNYANTLKVTDVAEIVFYAKGNKSEIERILSWVYALGKKESQGYGIVFNTQGQVKDRAKLMDTLQEMMQDKYSGGAEKLSKTTKGMWSTVTGVS